VRKLNHQGRTREQKSKDKRTLKNWPEKGRRTCRIPVTSLISQSLRCPLKENKDRCFPLLDTRIILPIWAGPQTAPVGMLSWVAHTQLCHTGENLCHTSSGVILVWSNLPLSLFFFLSREKVKSHDSNLNVFKILMKGGILMHLKIH